MSKEILVVRGDERCCAAGPRLDDGCDGVNIFCNDVDRQEWCMNGLLIREYKRMRC